LMLGVHIERAQLIARLLAVCFSDHRRTAITSHLALMSLLRMACALEPYLRVYTAEIEPRLILEFLLFNEEFPRAIRFSTARIEDHLNRMSQTTTATSRPVRPSASWCCLGRGSTPGRWTCLLWGAWRTPCSRWTARARRRALTNRLR
jgi:uncharacterized alpha-E superfamily protein